MAKKKSSTSFYKYIENKEKTNAQVILYLSGSKVLLTEVQTVLAYKIMRTSIVDIISSYL